MDLSVAIVSWKVKEKLNRNLNALFNSQGDFKFEVFVVDNNSSDGSVEMIKENFPLVNLIINSGNRGFAAANNQAIKKCRGEYILLLNPDMQLRSDTLIKILSWAKQNPKATVIGCKLIDEKNNVIKQVRKFPKFFDQLMITLKLPHLFSGITNKYLCAEFDYNQAAQVDSIRGAFFLINRESYKKVSGRDFPYLDENYFVWFEEVDFCRELSRLGGEVWYTPDAQCVDYVGQSFAQIKRGQAQKYFSDSMLKYFEKWGKKWEYIILRIAWCFVRIFYK
jgi:GT2 family glycosyltransferase